MIETSILRKWFDFHFTRYTEEWIDEALAGFGDGRELFFSDLGCIHPGLAARGIFDDDVLAAIETDAGLQAAFLYRLEHSIFRRDAKHPSLRYFAQLMRVKTGAEIYYSTEIGPRFRVEHGFALIIGPRNRIGADFTVHRGVTLGQRHMFSPHETMTIGDHCVICEGAKVLGAITLGDHVTVATDAVLLSDATSPGTYAGIPAAKIEESVSL